MKCTEPLPNSDWNENPEWISLRKSVFKNLALIIRSKKISIQFKLKIQLALTFLVAISHRSLIW